MQDKKLCDLATILMLVLLCAVMYKVPDYWAKWHSTTIKEDAK